MVEILSLSLDLNLSLALHPLFSTFGPDVGLWPNCWVSVSFSALSSLGRGRTTTTSRPLVGCVFEECFPEDKSRIASSGIIKPASKLRSLTKRLASELLLFSYAFEGSKQLVCTEAKLTDNCIKKGSDYFFRKFKESKTLDENKECSFFFCFLSFKIMV